MGPDDSATDGLVAAQLHDSTGLMNPLGKALDHMGGLCEACCATIQLWVGSQHHTVKERIRGEMFFIPERPLFNRSGFFDGDACNDLG